MVQGPPGTGKTSFLVECVAALLSVSRQLKKGRLGLFSGWEGAIIGAFGASIFPILPIQWGAKELLGVSQPSNSNVYNCYMTGGIQKF